jgi:DNA-binding MarR family transcriptional regulator
MKISLPGIPRNKLDDYLFEALKAVYSFERRKINLFGLDYTSIIALQMLRRKKPQRMKELVESISLPFSSATRLFGKLEEAGYVKRVYAEGDRRGVHVYLTGSGEKIVKKIEDDTFRIISETSKQFDSEALERFIWVAKNMGRILEADATMTDEDKR